mgnify:CR=1 FL=1
MYSVPPADAVTTGVPRPLVVTLVSTGEIVSVMLMFWIVAVPVFTIVIRYVTVSPMFGFAGVCVLLSVKDTTGAGSVNWSLAAMVRDAAHPDAAATHTVLPTTVDWHTSPTWPETVKLKVAPGSMPGATAPSSSTFVAAVPSLPPAAYSRPRIAPARSPYRAMVSGLSARHESVAGSYDSTTALLAPPASMPPMA